VAGYSGYGTIPKIFIFPVFRGTEHMAYILKNQPPATTGSRRLATFIALAGLVLTIAQVGYISRTGDTLCLNDGCAIVESLTRMPPLFFNLAGAGFFLVMLILIRLGKSGYDRPNFWLRAAGLALLAAMAIEGVLLSFQLQVSRQWCSYCLVIFACVFLLNLSLGWRQFIRGLTVLAAVIVASLSLDYASPSALSSGEQGSYGEIVRPNATIRARLYFSAACPHCEEVIASLNEKTTCQIGLYPLDPVPEQHIAGLKKNPRYDSAINRALLQGLGVNEVPALVVSDGKEIRVITGKDAILAFLERCRPAPALTPLTPEGQSATPTHQWGQSNVAPPLENDAGESCPIGTACPPETSAPR